jgi:peroxiredoxin
MTIPRFASHLCLVGLVALFLINVAVRAEENSPPPTVKSLLEELQATVIEEPLTVPDFELPTVDGKITKLADFSGKVLLLNFWATWCPYCRAERASLQALHEKYKDQGLAIIAISIDRAGIEVVKQYVTEHQLTFVNLHDQTQQLAAQYGVRGIPATFVITSAGKPIGGVIGPRAWDSATANSLVELLLAPHTPESVK